MSSPSRPSRRSFVGALAAVPTLLWARRASALVPALARHMASGLVHPPQASPMLGAVDHGPVASAPAQRARFLTLRSPAAEWVEPGRVVRASGIASVAFCASRLILLGNSPNWRIRGLWINDRLVSGTEDLRGDRCDAYATSPSFPGFDVEVGDEVRVAAEFAGIGERGLWGGGMLTYWSPPLSDDELGEQILSGLRGTRPWTQESIEEFAKEYRAHRARCVEAAIRMSDEEAQPHVAEYRRWRDLARAGLVG